MPPPFIDSLDGAALLRVLVSGSRAERGTLLVVALPSPARHGRIVLVGVAKLLLGRLVRFSNPQEPHPQSRSEAPSAPTEATEATKEPPFAPGHQEETRNDTGDLNRARRIG